MHASRLTAGVRLLHCAAPTPHRLCARMVSVLLAVLFVIAVLGGMRHPIGPFLGDIGHLVTNVIHSGAEFLAGFGRN